MNNEKVQISIERTDKPRKKAVRALINPSGDLKRTEELVTALIRHYLPGSEISNSQIPSPDVLLGWLDSHRTSIFIYSGHGGMERYLPPKRLSCESSLTTCPILLFGCSSGRLGTSETHIYKPKQDNIKAHEEIIYNGSSKRINADECERPLKHPKTALSGSAPSSNNQETPLLDEFKESQISLPEQTQLCALVRTGSPLVLCSMWDVTDRDLDKITEKVVASLGPGLYGDNDVAPLDARPIIRSLGEGRRSCTLPLMNGGAVVIYMAY
jgi:hypothetical protein